MFSFCHNFKMWRTHPAGQWEEGTNWPFNLRCLHQFQRQQRGEEKHCCSLSNGNAHMKKWEFANSYFSFWKLDICLGKTEPVGIGQTVIGWLVGYLQTLLFIWSRHGNCFIASIQFPPFMRDAPMPHKQWCLKIDKSQFLQNSIGWVGWLVRSGFCSDQMSHKRQKNKKTNRRKYKWLRIQKDDQMKWQKDKRPKKSLILWCQCTFAILQYFNNDCSWWVNELVSSTSVFCSNLLMVVVVVMVTVTVTVTVTTGAPSRANNKVGLRTWFLDPNFDRNFMFYKKFNKS